MEYISGGVCAPKGFKANGVHCGIRQSKSKLDLALIYSEKRAAAAAVYTKNLVKGAPLDVTKANISDGYAQAVLCNSGNANTCNAGGMQLAQDTCKLLGAALKIPAEDVIVASTGVIGQPMSIAPFEKGIPALTEGLGDKGGLAAAAIMTTDTIEKELAVKFTIGGVECRMGGIAKGSGMIHPNMATMLVFITTDAAIVPSLLQKALSEDVKASFNMVSVDGDTSTNDMVSVMANGMAENPEIQDGTPEFDIFKEALAAITTGLCKLIAKDGEGATKLLQCTVSGAAEYDIAAVCAKSVICSSLVKAAMFGADANWGRVLCALGYSGADIDVKKVDVSFRSSTGEVAVCKDGASLDFSEELAKKILSEDEIDILVSLNSGGYSATAWGCDLTYDYVKINGDYRT